MNNEYLSNIEEDAELYNIVRDKLADLDRLNSNQIEKLVFYLKSLRTYYPRSENNTSFYAEFEPKLEKLRNSPEQISLQRQAFLSVVKGIACCTLSGLLIAAAALAAIGGFTGIAIGILVVSGALILFAEGKLLKRALLISKEQDRKFFLSSIRTAKACNELDWAGLFTYNQASRAGPQSNADIARTHVEIGRLSSELRAALYNDEYFQYSPPELRSYESVDA